MSRKPDPDDDGRGPSADRTDRHRGDQILRSSYFEIFLRPKKGPNRWRRRDKKDPRLFEYFTEREAHETRLEELKAAAANAMKGSP